MGQAKARGTKEQRVAEAVELSRIKALADKAEAEKQRLAWEEKRAAAQEERERLNAERIARGEPQLGTNRTYPQRTGGRGADLITLLAVAALATMGSVR